MGWRKHLLTILLVSPIAWADKPQIQMTVKATAPPLHESSSRSSDDPSFESKNAGKTFYLGLAPHEKSETAPEPLKDTPVPGKFDLRDYIKDVMKLAVPSVHNQGSCGSCVYNAVSSTMTYTHLAAGSNVPLASRQFMMDCAQRQWMCSGSFFEYVAKGAVEKGGAPGEAKYPYVSGGGREQSCQGNPGIEVKAVSQKLIDASAKSIATYLAIEKKAVAVTVAADGQWSGYSGGTYNGCSSMGTNHQVVIIGFNFETSVDKDGNAVFNDKGYPINGDGYAIVLNSWGSSWGVNGVMLSRWLGRSGQKCNNLAEEAGVIDVGISPKPPEPPVPPTPPTPPAPGPFALQAWMVYAALGLLGLIVVLQLVHNFSVRRVSAKK